MNRPWLCVCLGLAGCGGFSPLDPYLVRTSPVAACPGELLLFTARMPDSPVRVSIEGGNRGSAIAATLGADGTLRGQVEVPARWAGPVFLRFETAGGNVYRHRVSTCPTAAPDHSM